MTKAKTEKAVSDKAQIKAAVDAFYNKGIDLDTTAMLLTSAGVSFSSIQSTIESVGTANEWILTTEKIKQKVEKAIQGKVISHFLDVVKLAKEIDLAQLTQGEKEKAIIEFSGVKASDVKEGKKFKQLHNSGYHGAIADWIRANPDFTPEQIHSCGMATKAPNEADYYDEFLAYREFFRA